MEDNSFGNYGVNSGYGQIAPGRDVAKFRVPGQPGRPRSAQPVPSQVTAPAEQPEPQGPIQPFAGAQQTLGAQPAPQGGGFDGASQWMQNAAQGSIARHTPYEQGGITGHTGMQAPPIQAPAPTPMSPEGPQATPPPAAPAPDFSRLTGYDQGKFNDPNKHDAKYDMGRTLAQFDPRAGLTPEVIDALNKLGYGTFSGSGDKLSLSGLTDVGRQNNLTGDYQNADFNVGFKSGNGKWGYQDPAAEAAAPAAAAGLSPELLAMLQGGGQTQGAVAGAPAPEDQQSMLQKILQMLQQQQPPR